MLSWSREHTACSSPATSSFISKLSVKSFKQLPKRHSFGPRFLWSHLVCASWERRGSGHIPVSKGCHRLSHLPRMPLPGENCNVITESLPFSFPSQFCLLCYKKRTEGHPPAPIPILAVHSTLTLVHLGGPWWAVTEPVEVPRTSRCCWGREVAGRAGMVLGVPRSEVQGKGWQVPAPGRKQAVGGVHSVLAFSGWWGLEGGTWGQRPISVLTELILFDSCVIFHCKDILCLVLKGVRIIWPSLSLLDLNIFSLLFSLGSSYLREAHSQNELDKLGGLRWPSHLPTCGNAVSRSRPQEVVLAWT